MKKYQVTWGWEPPQYDKFKGNIRIFYHSQQKEREISHKNLETGDIITEIINEWICDVVEYENNEAVEILRQLKKSKNSIQCQRLILKEQISAYDLSRYVNEFIINGIPIWLDKDTRTGLQLRFEAEAAMGKTITTLWYEGQQFTLSLDKAIEMLKAIEVYASKCYDVTQEHLYNINSLEDVKNYDYKSGYPDKLNFDLL